MAVAAFGAVALLASCGDERTTVEIGSSSGGSSPSIVPASDAAESEQQRFNEFYAEVQRTGMVPVGSDPENPELPFGYARYEDMEQTPDELFEPVDVFDRSGKRIAVFFMELGFVSLEAADTPEEIRVHQAEAERLYREHYPGQMDS